MVVGCCRWSNDVHHWLMVCMLCYIRVYTKRSDFGSSALAEVPNRGNFQKGPPYADVISSSTHPVNSLRNAKTDSTEIQAILRYAIGMSGIFVCCALQPVRCALHQLYSTASRTISRH